MTLPSNTLTYDQTPSHRPALSDLQIGLKVNDDINPPKDPECPTAEELNQQAAQVAAAHRVLELATIAIGFTAGTPSVVSQTSVRTTEPTYTVTDMATGETKIEWPAGTFPVSISPPRAYLTEDFDGTINAVAISNGVIVNTRARSSGTRTDANFAVDIK